MSREFPHGGSGGSVYGAPMAPTLLIVRSLAKRYGDAVVFEG